jgi:transcriptional regulator with AAA-type ATPase domain/tetratricopeptide (TPR) repeat protein
MEPLAELLGNSPAIESLRAQARQLLRRGQAHLPPVLIQGETGVGKGLLARSLRAGSSRANTPFVEINCAALPATLLESEMFGFERGAFTDARHAKPGLFQIAHTGTMFLDEIGLLPATLQAKFLKVVEDKKVRRLGATRDEVIDVWILAASNEDLEAAVREGRFREDLYHRLSVLSLSVPPLRERGDDIVFLAEQFLARACTEYDRPPAKLDADARAALRTYAWPGNVRELSNVIERVAVLSETPTITAAMLGLRPSPGHHSLPVAASTVQDIKRSQLMATLQHTGWNISETARLLGVSRNTVGARMAKCGFHPDPSVPFRRHVPRKLASVPRPTSKPPAESSEAVLGKRHVAFLLARFAVSGLGQSGSPHPSAVAVGKIEGLGGRVEAASPETVVAAFDGDDIEGASTLAAYTALAIQRALRGPDPEADRTPGVTIAIHSEGMGEDQSPLPGAPLLERGEIWAKLDALVGKVSAGEIIIAGGTAQFLRRRFSLSPTGESSSDYRISPHAASSSVRESQFVGRSEELLLLMSRFEVAAQGLGQIVAIAGEPGIGKSRLLFEFRRRVVSDQTRHVEGHCYSFAAVTPYFPMLEIIRDICGLIDGEAPEVVVDKLGRIADSVGVPRGEMVPPLAALLLIKSAADEDRSAPEAMKSRIFAATRALLLGLSRERPLLIVVEDLQWIDESSEAMLAWVADGIRASRTLLVVTCRSGYTPGWMGRLYGTQISLTPLSRDESRSMVRAGIGAGEVPEPLAELIVDRAEGNPFFLEELLRTIRDGKEGVQAAVPETVQDVLMARLMRLEHQDRRVLTTAAVLGRDFAIPLLQALLRISDDELGTSLDHLQAGEFLLTQVDSGTVRQRFKHALTQEVAYGAISPAERRQLHGQVVAAMERLYVERLPDHAERLGDHAFEGELWDKAVVYLRQAGVKASLRSAGREAAARFERALQALEHLPQTRPNQERGIQLRLTLRNPLFLLADFGHALEVLGEVVALADSLDAPTQAGLACAHMANAHFMLGNLADGLRLAERARVIGVARGDAPLLAITCCHLGQLLYAKGAFPASVSMMDECLTHLESATSRHRSNMVRVYSVVARCFNSFSLSAQGRFRDAGASAERCLGLTDATDTPFLRALAAWAMGSVLLGQGSIPDAMMRLEEAYQYCRNAELLAIRPWIASDLAWARLLTGDTGAALSLISGAIQEAVSHDLLSQHSLRLAYLSEAQLASGQEREAEESATRAAALAIEHGEDGFRVSALRALAHAAWHRNTPDLEAAARHLGDALSLGEDLGMRPAIAHCHGDLAQVIQRAGRREEAKRHLERAGELYRDLGMLFWLERLRQGVAE